MKLLSGLSPHDNIGNDEEGGCNFRTNVNRGKNVIKLKEIKIQTFIVYPYLELVTGSHQDQVQVS
jgi:hypothetical protein